MDHDRPGPFLEGHPSEPTSPILGEEIKLFLAAVLRLPKVIFSDILAVGFDAGKFPRNEEPVQGGVIEDFFAEDLQNELAFFLGPVLEWERRRRHLVFF